MTDPEPRESSPSPSPLQQAKQELLQHIEERLRQSGEDLRQLLDAFAEAVPGLQPPPAPAPPEPADEVAALSSVRDSLAAIDGADSQSEVLSRLLEQATRYASRVALFLAGGDSDGSALLGWSATGFEQTGPSVEGLVLPLPEGSPWPAVLDGRGALQLSAAECAPLCSRIETALPRRGALVPLVLRDRVEAVLYGDQEDEEPFSLEALQVLTHGAAQTLEMVPLRQRPGSPTLRVGDALAPAPTPPAPEPAEPEPAPEPAVAEEPESGPPTLSTTPLEAVSDFESLSEEPLSPAELVEEVPPAPAPPLEPEPPPAVAPGEETVPALTRGERAAGFVLEPLDEEAGPAPAEPAFDLEGVDDLEMVDDLAAPPPVAPTPAPPSIPTPTPPSPAQAAPPPGQPTPPPAAPPPTTTAPPPATPPPAAPAPPPEAPREEAAAEEDVFFEPADAPKAPTPTAAPPAEPPPPPSPPPPAQGPAPPREVPPDVARDTQLIGALSQPPAAPPAPAPPIEDDPGGTAVSASGEVVPPADIEGPGWAFSGKPTSPQAGTEPLHDEARRLARLLVSEIKLYNEELIAEGKRKGNIYQELREDIDRSRQMYEERIDEQVRSSSDYFREELIRSLAGGDASVMGL